MAFLQELHAAIAWMGWYILPFVFVISLIVFFHELGHYLVGRWCGVKIDAFSLGFGPELFAWVDKRGTRWRLAAFPVGGYVKFHGDANAASAPDFDGVAAMAPQERGLTLAGQPLLNRAAIVAAGPIANFILALVIFALLFMVFGRAEQLARIGGVEPGSPAARAVSRSAISSPRSTASRSPPSRSCSRRRFSSTGLPMTFVVERNGGEVHLTATPEIAVVDQGALGKRRMGHLGLSSSRDPADVHLERCAAPTCVVWGAREVGFIVEATGAYVGGLFAGRETADGLSGPIGVGQIAGEMAKVSLLAIAQPRGSVFGLGRADESAAGAAARRRPSVVFRRRSAARAPGRARRVQQIGLRIGFAFVALLVIFTTSHDILRLVGGAN